ncbi:MAG TPA: tRNA pseudouridine(55) synthase TruB [Acidimicrobiia bacterium]|nr:tRNA pseudouridine(55) synthase TruB [Acidimicrobiia bacterium]
MPEGFLIVDKPGGLTSHDVVARVRTATGVRRVGHAGTLDPMATGVVVVALGRATRLIRFVQDLPKEYLAVARFGIATDSLDADGQETERQPMEISADDVEAVLPGFLGTIQQSPPMYSAVKVDGERLYEKARRGEVVDRAPRPVEVHELEMTSFEPGPYPEVGLRVVCGKGTYIRSLADDIAREMGGRAHLIALRRTRVGSLALDRSVAVDDLTGYERHLLTPAEGLADLDVVEVDDQAAQRICHGAKFTSGPLVETGRGAPMAVVDASGRLMAVYRREDGVARPEVVVA